MYLMLGKSTDTLYRLKNKKNQYWCSPHNEETNDIKLASLFEEYEAEVMRDNLLPFDDSWKMIPVTVEIDTKEIEVLLDEDSYYEKLAEENEKHS